MDGGLFGYFSGELANKLGCNHCGHTINGIALGVEFDDIGGHDVAT